MNRISNKIKYLNQTRFKKLHNKVSKEYLFFKLKIESNFKINSGQNKFLINYFSFDSFYNFVFKLK